MRNPKKNLLAPRQIILKGLWKTKLWKGNLGYMPIFISKSNSCVNNFMSYKTKTKKINPTDPN